MEYWLIKSEPEEYSFQDLQKDGKTMWDGVRNYAARNHLRGMKKGDLVLFYHSVNDKEVVGICKVLKEHYPDPTADSGDWSVVEFAPVKPLKKKVTLAQIKTTNELQNIGLVRIGRLSVMPLAAHEFEKILEMGETSI
ncbi:MAG: EVE domain-containing protein [Lewinellaceae bacterium]|nr:EVE domain-containing protein [Saprospiraceae bacterium]MCB9339902.1 EVE domain-containing protein [Lewinellaceae bacterium]